MKEEQGVPRKIIVPAWLVLSLQRGGDDFRVEVEHIDIDANADDLPDWIRPDDFLAEFYAANGRTRQTSRKLPHLRFSQAIDISQLEEFVGEFGPVLGRMQGLGRAVATRVFVQNIPVLRAQQAAFAATRKLVSFVNELEHVSRRIAKSDSNIKTRLRSGLTMSDRQLLRQIADAIELVKDTIGCAVQESSNLGLVDELKAITCLLPQFRTGRDEVDNLSTSHQLLCAIFNVFTPKLYYAKGMVQECPESSQTGIRPLIYFMLREVYLMKHRIRLCKREDCGHFFIPSRLNVEFCSVECGSLVRQRRFSARRASKTKAVAGSD